MLPLLQWMTVADPIFQDENPSDQTSWSMFCKWLPVYKQRGQNGLAWGFARLSCIEHACDVLGELFWNVWSNTAHCKSSSVPLLVQKQSPVNASVIMVVSHIIDLWDIFLEDPFRD